jgi:hypothetical protein
VKHEIAAIEVFHHKEQVRLKQFLNNQSAI